MRYRHAESRRVRARSLTADSRRVARRGVPRLSRANACATAATIIGSPSPRARLRCCGSARASPWRGEWACQPGGGGSESYWPGRWRRNSTAPFRWSLAVIGVTGTNGKTSVTRWIAQAMDRQARVPA